MTNELVFSKCEHLRQPMSKAKKNHSFHTNSTIDRESELLHILEIHYNQHMTAHTFYRTAVMRKHECLPTLYFCVSGFLTNVTKSFESVKKIEESHALQKKKIPNHILSLKLKLMILIARINIIISIMDTNYESVTTESFNDIMEEMKKHTLALNIKNNPPLQEEIHFAITKITDYGQQKKLKNYDTTEWAKCGVQYVLQYSDGIPKFMAFRDMNTRAPSPTNLAICTETFEIINRKYNPLIGSTIFTLKDKVSYLMALTWMYELAIKNNTFLKNTQLSNYNTDNKIPVVPQNHPLHKYLNILKEYKRTYLHKINAVIESISIEELIEDITTLHEYHRFLNDFYIFFQNQMKDLISINTYLSESEEAFKYTVETRKWFVEFHIFNVSLDNLVKDTIHNVEIFKDQVNHTSYINEIYTSETKLTNFITLHAAYQSKNAIINSTSTKKADENIDTLLAPKKTNNRNKKNKNQTPPSAPNTKSKTPKNNRSTNNSPQVKNTKNQLNTEKTISTKEPNVLQKKAETALTEKSYSEALHFFKLYYFESSNTHEKLDALYGSIFSFEKIVQQSLKKINKIYGFSIECIEQSDQIISEAKENIKNIEKQFKTYNTLTQSLEKDVTDSKYKDICLVKEILEKEFTKITKKMNALEEIRERNIKERERKQILAQKEQELKLFKPKKTQISPARIDMLQFPTLSETVEPSVSNTNSTNLPNNSHMVEVENTNVNFYKPKYKQIDLPTELKKTFEFLQKVKGQHYLVGSKLLYLLLTTQSKVAIHPSDMDFLSLHSISDDWIRNGDFRQTTKERHLFKLNKWSNHKPELPVEVWLEDTTHDLVESLLTRDFTISALACDKKGKITDPTGLGLDDFEQELLRTIGDANERIKKSPCIILRALKFSMLGFTLDEELRDAIHNWQPDNKTDFAQLHEYVEKSLFSPYQDKYIEQLKSYCLFNKLFKIADNAETEEAKAILMAKLKTTSLKYNYRNQNYFFVNAQLSAQLSDLEIKQKELEEELQRYDVQLISNEQEVTPIANTLHQNAGK